MTVKFSNLPAALSPEHESCWQGMVDLFFAAASPIGRRLPSVLGHDDKPITGPWRNKRWSDRIKAEVSTYETVDKNTVAMHLGGVLYHGGAFAWLQSYAASLESKAVYTAVDFDVVGESHAAAPEHFNTQGEALEAAKKLIAVAEALELTAHLELTKSGGYRAWIFHRILPAAHARDLGRLLLQRAGLHPAVEVFPKTAFLVEGQVGSAVFLPYNEHNARNGRQVMINPETGAVRMVEEFVQAALAGRSDPALVAKIVTEAEASGELKPTVRAERAVFDGESGLSRDPEQSAKSWDYQISRCTALGDIVARCEAGVTISRAEWFALATHLRAYGDWGYDEFHRLSEFDGRYNEHEADGLIDSIQGGPMTCARMGCGKQPQKDCGLPEGKTSAISFAYQQLRQLPMLKARSLRGDDENVWSFRDTIPGEESRWKLETGGLFFTSKNAKGEEITEKVLGAPLHIGGRVTDIDSGIESVELVWHQDRGWKHRVVPRRTVSDTRAILALADDGLGVHSGNAALLVKYIAYLLDIHNELIPLSTIVSTTGWKRVEGQDVFIWGNQVITAHNAPQPQIAFEAASADTTELTQAFRSSGTFEGWRDAHLKIGHLPTVAFGVMASLAAPFLRHLNLGQNPITDFAGRSSSGKTTAMKVAASAWGYPPEMGGLIRSWNSTQVFIERMVSTCADLPSFLDESHVVRPELLQNTTYQLANGTGKGRGAKDGGTQRTARFRSVVISGGETQLTTASAHDGAVARVIGFWGSPFGEGQAELVRSTTQAVLENHGHAGPLMVMHFLGRQEECLETLHGWQEDFLALLLPQAHDGIAERLATMYAAIGAVGEYANNLFKLGWDVEELVLEAFNLGAQGRKTDNAQIALEDAVSHALGHRDRYEGGVFGTGFERETEGRFVSNAKGDSFAGEIYQIAFLPTALRGILETRNHNYDATLNQWRERQWILTDDDKGRNTRRVRLKGVPTRMVVITTEAMKIGTGDRGQETWGDPDSGMAQENPSSDHKASAW